MPGEFPSPALLVAVGVSDGGKPVITLQSEVPVLGSQLSHWMRSVNTSPSLPQHMERQLHRGGGQGDSAAGFGFPARGVQGQSSTLKNYLRGCASNSPCSVSINSFLIQLL